MSAVIKRYTDYRSDHMLGIQFWLLFNWHSKVLCVVRMIKLDLSSVTVDSVVYE